MTTEQKIDQCKSINWYALTNDQLNHILEIAGTPVGNLRDRPCQFAGIIDAAKYCTPATPAASPEGFVQSPNCIGGCTSPHGGLCGPCYRLNYA